MKVTDLPNWTPHELRSMVRNGEAPSFKSAAAAFERLVTDERVREFWDWLDAKNDWLEKSDEGFEFGPQSLFWSIARGLELPEQPGASTPKAQQKYLDDVRSHAVQLANLLRGTRFDIDLAKVAELMEVERYELPQPTDFPLCVLTEQLQAVISWAEQEDSHDRNLTESWMLRHGGLTAKKTFLVSRLMWDFERFLGCLPPWQLFADLVNAALGLDGESINPDGLQKLVQRIKDREKSNSVVRREDEISHPAGSMIEIMNRTGRTGFDLTVDFLRKHHQT